MRQYNWPDLLRYAKQFKITAFYTVPSIYLRMSKAPEVTGQFSWLAGAVTGAAPMDGKLQQSANKKLGAAAAAAAAGSPQQQQQQMLGQMWGLSETTGAITAVLAGESVDTGSIGSILPTIQLRLVDDDFKDVEPGRDGELVIRGPVVTRGYYGNPAATRDAFRDGWFCSGDIGVMRNGKFYVVDRKKVSLKPPSPNSPLPVSTRTSKNAAILTKFANTRSS